MPRKPSSRAIATTTTVQPTTTVYDDALTIAGQVANHYARADAFPQAHATWTQNTRRRYMNDLKRFSAYLHSAGIERPADALFHDPAAWRGMSYGLLKGLRAWLEQQGYAVGTIKGCITTIHVFCHLAGPGPIGAGVLDEETLVAILTIRGYSGRKARNVDQMRESSGIPTRRGHKKAEPTPLSTTQALTLKKVTTHPNRPTTREHDLLLPARDALLMGLLVEHALRCSEVALLKIEAIDLKRGTITIYRPKTHRTDVQKLHKHTRLAAEVYLELLGRARGPLFSGYDEQQPLSTRAINKRVAVLGGELGIERLSPHDLRHHWTFDALLNQTPLNIVQADGGWETEIMPLRYARQFGTTGGSASISETEEP